MDIRPARKPVSQAQVIIFRKNFIDSFIGLAPVGAVLPTA